jgi:hypothetical protein
MREEIDNIDNGRSAFSGERPIIDKDKSVEGGVANAPASPALIDREPVATYTRGEIERSGVELTPIGGDLYLTPIGICIRVI